MLKRVDQAIDELKELRDQLNHGLITDREARDKAADVMAQKFLTVEAEAELGAEENLPSSAVLDDRGEFP